MTTILLKQLMEAKSHMKKAALKMDVTMKNDTTDQYVYNAQIKALKAIKDLEQALYILEKGDS